MAARASNSRLRLRRRRNSPRHSLLACGLAALRASGSPHPLTEGGHDYRRPEFLEWGDGPSSRDEFDHNNDPRVCGVEFLTVDEWEAGRHWERQQPVIVRNVTAGWAALTHWKK